MTLIAQTRRHALALMSAGLLAACSGGDSIGPTGDLVDMSIGAPDAPVELVEYASATCGACAGFHVTMKDTIETLVDEGKLRYVFREYPLNGSPVDVAAFAVARCAGEDKYFDVIDDLFTNQRGIVVSAQNGSLRAALQAVAARNGVEQAAFETCLTNEEIKTNIQNAALAGAAAGVRETPTLFLNGIKLEGAEGRSPESLTELVEERAAS